MSTIKLKLFDLIVSPPYPEVYYVCKIKGNDIYLACASKLLRLTENVWQKQDVLEKIQKKIWLYYPCKK